MIRTTFLYRSLFLIFLGPALPPLTGQTPVPESVTRGAPSPHLSGPGEVLAVTRKVADKVLRETSFFYRLAPAIRNAGISRVEFPGAGSPSAGTVPVWYALGALHSAADTTGVLGISYRGEVKIFLNGREIFRGSSPSDRLREYAYGRFWFQEEVPVTLAKRRNEVLVKCRQTKESSLVLLLPLDDEDAAAGYVRAVPVLTEAPGAKWITSGPWDTPAGKGMEAVLPPERVAEESHGTGRNISAWSLEPPPLERKLVIPPEASYRRDSYADWHYANGGTLLAILSLYEMTGDSAYFGFAKAWADNFWENLDYFRWQYRRRHVMRGSFHRFFRMTMLDDSGGPALSLAQLQLLDRTTPYYLPVLFGIRQYVMEQQQRLSDGTFCRPEPEASTVWADDLFMSVPFLLRMARITGDTALYDEVAGQVIRFQGYLSDPETGLWFHGWYDRREVNSPVRWGRANGWVAWAISEALMHMPPDHPDYRTILDIFRAHMEALRAYQDPSGMWHQVLDHPGTFEETSCTAMFTLAMARGVRMGWLDGSYRKAAMKGWHALRGKIAEDGTVKDICRGTPIGEDVAFYAGRDRFDHDPRGLGAVITAGCEISEMAGQ